MRRLLALTASMTMLLGALFVPSPAAGQTGDACADALNGIAPAGYTIVSGNGGGGSQVVLGTDGPDTLSGGGGNDLVCGFAGADILSGGGGNDTLVGGPGEDQLYGGTDNDTLYGDTDDTALNGGSGQNQVFVAEVAPPPPPPSITLSFQPYAADPNYCLVFAHFRNFAPDTTYDLTYQSREPSTGGVFPPRGAGQVTTDGTGAADYQFPLIWDQTDDELRIYTGDVSSASTRVSC